VDNRNYKYYCG